MKKLYIMRHAKSDWSEPFESDFDRGLKKRGYEDAILIAKELKRKKVLPNLLLSSSAIRAKITSEIAGAFMGYDIDNIKFNKQLYFSNASEILEIIKSVNSNVKKLFIVGHNPELTELINQLAYISIDNLPTSGVVAISFKTDSWKKITKGKREFFIYPKMYKGI